MSESLAAGERRSSRAYTDAAGTATALVAQRRASDDGGAGTDSTGTGGAEARGSAWDGVLRQVQRWGAGIDSGPPSPPARDRGRWDSSPPRHALQRAASAFRPSPRGSAGQGSPPVSGEDCGTPEAKIQARLAALAQNQQSAGRATRVPVSETAVSGSGVKESADADHDQSRSRAAQTALSFLPLAAADRLKRVFVAFACADDDAAGAAEGQPSRFCVAKAGRQDGSRGDAWLWGVAAPEDIGCGAGQEVRAATG